MTVASRSTALYTCAQVRGIDHRAIDALGISGFELMQRAAAAAFTLLRRRWPEARRVVLLAGRGNNGGDAFLLGVRALRAGLDVLALALPGEADGDALRARLAFATSGGRVLDASEGGSLPLADVYVDGLFGTGLARPVAGIAAGLVTELNASDRPVLALDLPSGLDADTGTEVGPTVHADATVSFVAWKRGLFTGQAVDCCGELVLADLDLPEAVLDDQRVDAELLDESIGRWLGRRIRGAHKGLYGHVLAVGGDLGMGGAIQLVAAAALRCGAGLVSAATRAGSVVALNAAHPEVMAHVVDDAAALAPLAERSSVLAIGSGLGRGAWGQALLEAGLASGRPCVIDADALNLLAEVPRELPSGCVLTPHPGEAARLLGRSVARVQADRFAAARKLAARLGAVVVLKGAGSLIAAPDGQVALCRWGNSGMASGGMGDALGGVIAALRAQGLSPWDAARLGVGMHARAGDLAAGALPRGLIASDLFAPLRQLANEGAW